MLFIMRLIMKDVDKNTQLLDVNMTQVVSSASITFINMFLQEV